MRRPGSVGALHAVSTSAGGTSRRGSRTAATTWAAPRCRAICTAICPVVHRVYPLTDVAAAHEAFERGGVPGKHVLAVTG